MSCKELSQRLFQISVRKVKIFFKIDIALKMSEKDLIADPVTFKNALTFLQNNEKHDLADEIMKCLHSNDKLLKHNKVSRPLLTSFSQINSLTFSRCFWRS